MRHIWECRRTYLATLGLILLFILGYLKGADVSVSISLIVTGVAGANAYQKKNINPLPSNSQLLGGKIPEQPPKD